MSAVLKSFLLTFFLVNVSPCIETKIDCSVTPCNDFSLVEVLQHLWNTPTNLTPRGCQLANTIIDLTWDMCDDDPLLSKLFIYSLWAVEVYSNYQHSTLSTADVCEKVLSITYQCQTDEDYNNVLREYGELVRGAVKFTISTSLGVAGCPVNTTPEIIRPEQCLDGKSVNQFLRYYGHTLAGHRWLYWIVNSLNRSEDPRDKTVALFIAALSNGPLVGLYEEVVHRPEFLRALQLKACDIPIPPERCAEREEDIKRRLDAVECVILQLVGNLKKQ